MPLGRTGISMEGPLPVYSLLTLVHATTRTKHINSNLLLNAWFDSGDSKEGKKSTLTYQIAQDPVRTNPSFREMIGESIVPVRDHHAVKGRCGIGVATFAIRRCYLGLIDAEIEGDSSCETRRECLGEAENHLDRLKTGL